MKIYQTPTAEIMELDFEAAVLAGSPTGESYDSQENFGGEWS